MGRLTRARNTIATSFNNNDRAAVPTVAQFNALNTGLSVMRVRRIFGSFLSGMRRSLTQAAIITAPPGAFALANQTATRNVAITPAYVHAASNDPENATITYTAILDGGGALPAGLVYTPGSRSFSGTITAPIGVYTIRVTAADIYGRTSTGTFTYTVS